MSSGLMQSIISQLSISDDDDVEFDDVNDDGVGERLICCCCCCCCFGLSDFDELDTPPFYQHISILNYLHYMITWFGV